MLSFTMIQQHDAKSNPDQLNRRNGNTLVASDIYGTGVRVGVYSQVIGVSRALLIPFQGP